MTQASEWPPALRQTGLDLAALAALATAYLSTLLFISFLFFSPFGSSPNAFDPLEPFFNFAGIILGPEAMLIWLLQRLGRNDRLDTPLALWADGAIAAIGAVGIATVGTVMLVNVLNVEPDYPQYDKFNSAQFGVALWTLLVPLAIVLTWAIGRRRHQALWCLAAGLGFQGGGLLVWVGLRPDMSSGGEATIAALLTLAAATAVAVAAQVTPKLPE